MYRIISCLGTGIMLVSLVGITQGGPNDSDSDWYSDQTTITEQGGSQSGSAYETSDEDAPSNYTTDTDSPHSPGSASAMPDAAKTGSSQSTDLPENIHGVVMELFPECQVIGVEFEDGLWEVQVFYGDDVWETSISDEGEVLTKPKSISGQTRKDDSSEGTKSNDEEESGTTNKDAADDNNDDNTSKNIDDSTSEDNSGDFDDDTADDHDDNDAKY